MELKLGGDFIHPSYSMVSGSAIAESNTYTKVLSKTGKIYLVADRPDAASYIYVEGGPGSDGFGGRTLAFTLTDGTVLQLKGPWHTNPHDLLANTGIDLRNKFMTWGCVGTGREHSPMRVTGLVYFDPEPTIGAFDRVEKLAERMAEQRIEQLAYFSESQGGSSCGFTRFKP